MPPAAHSRARRAAPRRTYQPAGGAEACLACPDVFTSQQGSVRISECYCPPGFWTENMQNAQDIDSMCLPCPTNAICRGGCKENPTDIACSDDVAIPLALDQLGGNYNNELLGGLTWIPKAMPYPTAGYLHILDLAFRGLTGDPTLQCELSSGCPGDGCSRIGPEACWWPLVHTSNGKLLDEAFIMSANVYVTNQVAAHNGVEYPLPWWAEAYERKNVLIGSRRAACHTRLLASPRPSRPLP